MLTLSSLRAVTLLTAVVSQNGRVVGAGTRSGLRAELVGLGLAQQPRQMIEVCLASGGRLSVQRGTRCGMQNVVVAFVNDDPHDLKVVLEEVGNDECILHEETEVGVGAPFGGTQLNKGA